MGDFSNKLPKEFLIYDFWYLQIELIDSFVVSFLWSVEMSCDCEEFCKLSLLLSYLLLLGSSYEYATKAPGVGLEALS